MTKPSALELIETSFKYSYDRHFVTQFFCLLPYESIKFIYGSDAITNSPSGQALGLLTIVVWCGYGLMTTNQFYFLLVASILFFMSQVAFYADNHALDVVLTLSCVGVMMVKMYVARHYTFNLLRSYEVHPFKIKEHKDGFRIYRRSFGLTGFRWWLANCKGVAGTEYPILHSRESAERIITALRNTELNKQRLN